MRDAYTAYRLTQTRNDAGEMANTWTQQEAGLGFLYDSTQVRTTAAGSLVVAASIRILLPTTTTVITGDVLVAGSRRFRVTATRPATRSTQADLEETRIQVGD